MAEPIEIWGVKLTARLIAIAVGIIALVVVVGLVVRSCDSGKQKAAQSRVDQSQGEAQRNSSADAINTVTGVGSNTSASEELTRQNERDIRNAEGANQRVGSGVDLAGRRSLCKRAAYRDDPKCRMFKPPAR